jgi:hypothetical protein
MIDSTAPANLNGIEMIHRIALTHELIRNLQ